MNNIHQSSLTFMALIALALPGAAPAQTELDVQSSARPFDLDISAPVMQSGSDEASAQFQQNDLPGLQDFINDNLSERQKVSDLASKALDPSKLYLTTEADVRVYFLGEGAGFQNTLGYNDLGIGVTEGNPELIFPNASSLNSWYREGNLTQGMRINSAPVLPGDFVELGTLGVGTQLDFFLIANGANNPKLDHVWTAHNSYNSDGLQHVVAYAMESSPYLIIGFEDLAGGGDRDYNDLVFAVDIGERNVTTLANPEPGLVLSLMSALVFVMLTVRRR